MDVNTTNLNNDTPDPTDNFKLPPIRGSKNTTGIGHYKKDKIRMARNFMREQNNVENSPN